MSALVGMTALDETGVRLRGGDALWWGNISDQLLADTLAYPLARELAQAKVAETAGCALADVATATFSSRYLRGVWSRHGLFGEPWPEHLGVLIAYWRAPR